MIFIHERKTVIVVEIFWFEKFAQPTVFGQAIKHSLVEEPKINFVEYKKRWSILLQLNNNFKIFYLIKQPLLLNQQGFVNHSLFEQ
jgi:hypothetical protein